MKRYLWRPVLLVVLLVLLIMILGQNLGHRDGLILSVSVSLGIIGLFSAYGDVRLAPRLKVQELLGQDPWKVRLVLETLSDKARVPTPRLFVIQSDAPQALALGRTRQAGKVYVTSGLLELLNKEEITAVLAYLLMCIKIRATLGFTIASAFADAILTVGGSLDWLLGVIAGSRRSDGKRVFFFTRTLAPLAATFVHAAVGRKPYFAADEATKQLLGEGTALAQVLWKLESYSLTHPFSTLPATAQFFIVNPLTTNVWGRYFHAHPLVRDRIVNLIGHYPI